MNELISRRLRYRVRVLGNLLGQTMTAQYGNEFLEKEEEIRLLAKSRRQNKSGDHRKLQEVLKVLDDDDLVSIARAFNQFLNLTSIAEQAETGEIEDMRFPETSHLSELLTTLVNNGTDQNIIADTIKGLHCDLVLTANPTEITRRTLIQKYNRISTALDKVKEDVPFHEDERIELERLIAEVWYTDEIRTTRPTPQEEAIWGYAVIEHSFWNAIPKLWEGLDALLLKHTGESMTLNLAPVRFSSSMGGDRDGNSDVTTEVTREVIRLARWMAADLYLRDVEELLSQLSMSQCTESFRAFCREEGSQEPYRVVLRGLRQRLTATRIWAEGKDPPQEDLILYRDDLFAPLHACYQSLKNCGMGIIADGLLKETLIRVSTFGVTLVDLNIRQSADKHIELLDELTEFLELGSYKGWSEKARSDFLLQELNTKRPLIPQGWEPEGSSGEVLRTFRLIAEGDAEGISSYIVSMAKNPSDVLAVVLLLQKCGLARKLPVVPLFETLDDLDNAAWTLERLLRTQWYTKYVEGNQQVMIGYSDSAKDAGQMAAAWAQYRAQEELVIVAKNYKVNLTLFHGRGGAAGRGGTPVRTAILSQPPGSVSHNMRITEQGEMIRFKYGSAPLALTNLDLVLSAIIEASLIPPPEPMENWRSMMDRLAEVASKSYLKMTQNNPDFVEYFVEGTPERELALLALGSHPARRANDLNNCSIDELRSIPWVFAWAQKRLMIPAWLGTDAAFSQELSRKDWFVLKEMIEEWPFFQSQLDMLEMVLAKSDADISERYDDALVPDRLKPMGSAIREQLSTLVANVNKIKGQSELLEKSPEIKQTIDLRHPYTDSLHFLQIELISRYRNQEDNETLRKALLVTIAGIAASMRNTG